MRDEPEVIPRRPSRFASLLLSLLLVALWGALRLVLFDAFLLPLTYVLPLLLCVWTRDRQALWLMAGVFAIMSGVELFWILPTAHLTAAQLWATQAATLVNICVGAFVVNLIIVLRERLEAAFARARGQAVELRMQGDELAVQNEELAQQSEELSRQADELSQQAEELAAQNEDVLAQSAEIVALNAELARREELLQALLETARHSGSEHTALQQICAAALDLFGDVSYAVGAYEVTPTGLRILALASANAAVEASDEVVEANSFTQLVIDQNRTASLPDTSLRPDLTLLHDRRLPRPGSVLCAPMRNGAGSFGAVTIYGDRAHDWTDEQFRLAEWLAGQCARVIETLRIQGELRDTDRRRREFLAILSHELRNPLAPIRYALELFGKDPDSDARARRVIARQLRHLVRLVDDLLDATRISSNKIQLRKGRVDLLPILQQTVETVAPECESAGHTLRLELPSSPLWIDADPDRIAQVVTNILNNAVRYTPQGGRITLRASQAGAEAAITIEDTGVGIAEEDLPKLFDMFAQVGGPGEGGLGLGLALVRGIVELHGGRVEARSEGPGRGAAFTVLLPLADAPAEAAVRQPAGTAVSETRRRVLVVDDNADAATMMATLLELNGHTVRVAHDGLTAVSAAREFVPDVALLDIGLPGIDGYEVARRLRQDDRTRAVHLIAVTGWGEDADRLRAQAAGFDAHLTKPAEPGRILHLVDRADGSGRAQFA